MDVPNPALLGTTLEGLGTAPATVVIEPPGDGPGYWAGGPSAVHHDGSWWLAYRLRRPVDAGRGYANVVARSDDGVHFVTVATVTAEQFGAASLERPALVVRPDGGWRLYVSCSTWASKHWWVEALDADDPTDLAEGKRTMVLPGDGDTAWKDVVVTPGSTWHMWACRHPITVPAEADEMSTWYATSPDGLAWHLEGPALAGRPGTWDSRGARVAAVVDDGGRWLALYDGRASAGENWEERTGVALGESPGQLRALDPGPLVLASTTGSVRYATVAADPDGGVRVFYEAARTDGAHNLRCEKVFRSESASSQSA